VLRYTAFGAVPVRARSWVVRRWLWDLTGWVTARSALSLYFRDRTARLTQPTLNARSVCAGRMGGHVGVGCVETQARAWPWTNEPLCVETQHVKSSRQRQIIQDC